MDQLEKKGEIFLFSSSFHGCLPFCESSSASTLLLTPSVAGMVSFSAARLCNASGAARRSSIMKRLVCINWFDLRAIFQKAVQRYDFFFILPNFF